MKIRRYKLEDYDSVASLYKQSDLYGGQFDEKRDSFDRLKKRIEIDSDSILVAEIDDKILGTVSLIDDGRVAWLFRFAVANGEYQTIITNLLYDKAIEILKEKGYGQVLVYSPVGNERFNERYTSLGFSRGGDYTCFWQDI